jgi:hypothetical protein
MNPLHSGELCQARAFWLLRYFHLFIVGRWQNQMLWVRMAVLG